jgi:glycolate oxidase iron-sulfur subunit
LKTARGKEFKAENETRRVAFFVGCMVNYVYPGVGESLIRVLNRRGVTVVVPERQACCGTPALSVGDVKAAARLARLNAETFADAGVTDIITACASCSKTLKSEMDEKGWEKFRVRDVTEYLVEVVSFVDGKLDRTVTYHDPCHLKWGQDIRNEPRELLGAICDYKEMTGADDCCGFGGTFSMFHHDLSQNVAGRKASSIASVDAATVATACPGCMLQLQTIIDEHNLNSNVRHIVELIDEAEWRAATGTYASGEPPKNI